MAKAESGLYSHMEVNRGLPARELALHFRRDGLHWVVASDIRRRLRFARINLVDAWPELPEFDIVLLRNVLIYFDACHQARCADANAWRDATGRLPLSWRLGVATWAG
ncbi:MAG: CheR family methyltransferase [Moraxellaceae bacterium]